MNTPSQPRTGYQFTLLVTLIGVLVIVLAIALAEMTVSAHQGRAGNGALKGRDKPHDESMDSLSCTQCHQFQNNRLVEGGQTIRSTEKEPWYAQIYSGASFLLGKLPDQMTSQETGHSAARGDTGRDQTYQPAASDARGVLNQPSRLPVAVHERLLH